jgi:glycosyltransferase involved in cell wall biosynthesis
VVSRAGAIPEVVGRDGQCADLVTPGDVGELETAIAALLDDPERRARMGKAGRTRVLERFSWHAVALATAAAYEEVSTSSTTQGASSTTQGASSTTGGEAC